MNLENNIDPNEISKFNALANEWWDTDGKLKTLHDINPTRLQFITDQTPLAGKRILDVGCGGGILTESMAKLDTTVTGIDMAEDAISIARQHSAENGLSIDYQQLSVESFSQNNSEKFDVITCLELLEHVPKPESVIQACQQLLKPNGYLFLSTINRTWQAYLFAIIGAEYVLRLLPQQTHDYDKFIKPSELSTWIRASQLQCLDIKGLAYNPFARSCSLTDNVSVNYILSCRYQR